MRRYYCVMLLAATAAAFCNQASADTPHHHRGYSPWFAHGYTSSLYGLGMMPVPPYYAIHPPVYYSHPVSRTYGRSPYACACQHREEKPQPVLNPHVPRGGKEELEPVEPAQAMARVITNPFYVDERVAATE